MSDVTSPRSTKEILQTIGGKAYAQKRIYLVFNGRAVPRTLCFNPSTIRWGLMQIVPDQLVCKLCRASQVAAHLLSLNMKIWVETKPADLGKGTLMFSIFKYKTFMNHTLVKYQRKIRNIVPLMRKCTKLKLAAA